MMKKIMLASLLCGCAAFQAPASVTATGFFVEVNGGGSYDKVKLYLAGKGQEKKDKVEFVEAHKNAGYIGGALGYGYEFVRGFYIGAKAYVNYDFAKIAKKQDLSGSFTFKSSVEGLESRSVPYAYDLEYKPMCNFGGALQVGFKVMPNVLVYASIGAEGTYSKANMAAEFGGFAYTRAGDKSMPVHALLMKSDTESSGFAVSTEGGKSADKIKVTTFSLVPGLGVKWFVTPNIFVGADVNIPCGFTRKVDTKYYSTKVDLPFGSYKVQEGSKAYACDQNGASVETPLKAGDACTAEVDMILPGDLNAHGNTLYVKRVVGVRYGLIVGFKF